MTTMDDYRTFIEGKIAFDSRQGFDVADADIHPILKPHQRDIVRWACAGGRRAIFAAFGLGKSVMQLEILRLTLAQRRQDAEASVPSLFDTLTDSGVA